MDRREWLTLIYREANRFVKDHRKLIADITADSRDIQDLQPTLWKQLRQCLTDADTLNDFIKFSLLKEPEPELWRDETHWEGVLVGVSLACLSHDVLGIIARIIDGELPETDPDTIMDYNPHAGLALNNDTGISVLRPGAPEDGDPDADDDDIDDELSTGYAEIFGDEDNDAETGDDEETL